MGLNVGGRLPRAVDRCTLNPGYRPESHIHIGEPLGQGRVSALNRAHEGPTLCSVRLQRNMGPHFRFDIFGLTLSEAGQCLVQMAPPQNIWTRHRP